MKFVGPQISPLIRTAGEEDLPAITEIYNQAIALRYATGDLDPASVDSRKKWLQEHEPSKHPVSVAIIDDSVVGWCSLSPYRPGRQALRHTAEISVYIKESFRNRGVGSSLVGFAIQECPRLGIKSVFAIVLDVNTASLNLWRKFGFAQWGHMPNIAEIDGKECGHLYYGLRVRR